MGEQGTAPSRLPDPPVAVMAHTPAAPKSLAQLLSYWGPCAELAPLAGPDR